MSEKAYLTPKVLKWARESAKLSEEIAASKISVSPDKIKEWEAGFSQPTIRQAQNLAKLYRRPFALFFLPEIPRDFQPLQDFRSKGAKPLSTASIFMIREIQQKQGWLRGLNEENAVEKNPFVGRFSSKDAAEKVAKDILDSLDIRPGEYTSENPINEWIAKAEAKGISISRTSFIHSHLKLDADEFQGFAIADAYAPFVFINSDDWDAAQLFTLVHELAHIWISASGISNDVDIEVEDREKFHPIELFCNEVAANALLPSVLVRKIDRGVYRNAADVFRTARALGVSSSAFLIRSLRLQIITQNEYRDIKREADIAYRAFLKREAEKKAKFKLLGKKGGPDYFLMQLYRNGRLFTHIVLDAFRGGNIEPTLASSLLNVQVNKFPKLEAKLYK